MAWTAQDVAVLKEAIKSGTLSVRHADGRSVTYQSLSEMRKLLREMEDDVAAQSGKPRRRVMRFYQSGRGYR